MLPAIAFAVTMGLTTAPTEDPPSPPRELPARKLPVPVELARKDAEERIRETFSALYAGRKLSQKQQLVSKLLVVAKDGSSDSATRYVALHEAREIAVEIGDPKSAMRVVRVLVSSFAVNPAKTKREVIERLGRTARTQGASVRLVRVCLTSIDEAVARFDDAGAKSIVSVAIRAAKRAKCVWLTANVAWRRDRLRRVSKELRRILRAVDRLVENEVDPYANMAVGRFLCLIAEQWDKGLPHLQRCGAPDWKKAANTELAKPTTPEAQAELGDLWWRISEREKDELQEAAVLRACHWYRKAHKQLSGLKQAELEKRLARAPRCYLSDLDEFDVRVGHGVFGKHGKTSNTPIVVNGVKSHEASTTTPLTGK